MTPNPSSNFPNLHHDARLVALATQAEEHFAGDPTVTLFKRQFGDVAQPAAAKVGEQAGQEKGQQQLIDRLWERNVIGATQRSLFHVLRRVVNAALQEGKGDHREALHQLRMARELAVWFQRSFGNNKEFEPGPFLPPAEPKNAKTGLHDELQRLRDDVEARRKELGAAQRPIDEARKAAKAEAVEKLTEERAAKAKADADIWEALASEQIEARQATAKAEAMKSALEAQNKKLLAELAALQAAAEALPPKQLALSIDQAAKASEDIELDEAATRKLIDRQLRDAGWEVDSTRLTFEHGVRPTKGKNLTIAESPTIADGKERGLGRLRALRRPAGRRRRRGEAEALGRDGRPPASEAVLARVPRARRRGTPRGEPVARQERRRSEGPIPLRNQRPPVSAPAPNEERHLVSRRTPPAEPPRASRIKDLRLENEQTFTDIFDVGALADLKPDRETKLQIATIQAMVKRVLGPHEEGTPVDQYDCIVVDECHCWVPALPPVLQPVRLGRQASSPARTSLIFLKNNQTSCT